MRYEFLGPLRVLNGGRMVDLGGPRQQRVLAVLLAVAPDEVSVDRLIDQVWGDNPPDTAPHVVRTYVSNLKQVLDGGIASDGQRYRLELDGSETDGSALSDVLESARTTVAVDPAAAISQLDSVLSLHRGRPFEGVGDDALLVRIKADQLEEQLLSARELRAEAALALGRHDEWIADLEALVASHPLRERSSELLMLALYRSERQAEALAVYRRLREQLIEQLGIEPARPLQELEERILLQDPALDLQPPHNVPNPTSAFVGRVNEFGQITKDLQAYRLVTLVGIGGVGKSRLAREVALSQLDDFPDGIWWVDFAPIDDPDVAVQRVADVLGVSAQPGISAPEVLRRYLAQRTTLLVFDNCEHVLMAAGSAASAILDADPGVKILATSRRRLDVSGEVIFPVPPMSLPDPRHGDPIAGLSDSEMLFAARAHQADPSAGNHSRADVARICVHLDGIPLAIEMAAARMQVLSSGQIADRLEAGDRHLLAWSERDRSPRQLTMESTIGWSYDLLSDAERSTLDRFAVFAGPFDISAAEAVAGFEPVPADHVLDLVGSLVGSSMLTPVRTNHVVRYRLLQTLREYAQRHLAETGAAQEAARRHARHHLELIREAGRLRMTCDFAAISSRLDEVRDDLVVALEWLLENEPERAIEAAPGLTEYWSRRGDAALAYRYGRRMFEVAPDANADLRADSLLCASFGAALSGDFELATRGPADAVQLATGAGWQTRLFALHALGNISIILGDLDTVESAGRSISALCDEEDLDLPRAYGTALLGLAEFFRDGDYELAGRYLDEAIDGMRSLRDYGGMKIYGLVTASTAAALRGDYESAERYATEAISLPGAAWTAAAYVVLGGYTLQPRGELERAGKVLGRGTKMAYEAGAEVWLRTGFLFLARLAAVKERWRPAARFFGACQPNLPAWGHQPRWWDLQTITAQALGEAEYRRLESSGRAAPTEDVLGWINEIVD